MCISPMGIINAGNPRQAALETYELTGLIHHNFSRDAACSMAAAVAEAFSPALRSTSILDRVGGVPAAAQRESDARLHRKHPGAGPRNRRVPDLPRALLCRAASCPASRCRMRARPCRWRYRSSTSPMATHARTILYGANFGRDADTIASMAGALAGALHGASALPVEWVEKMRSSGRRDQAEIAAMLVASSSGGATTWLGPLPRSRRLHRLMKQPSSDWQSFKPYQEIFRSQQHTGKIPNEGESQ